jgi:glutamate formiminotransferase
MGCGKMTGAAEELLLAVPNFSEGRDEGVLLALRDAAGDGGATVMDAAMDPDHNRAVVALFGPPGAVLRSLLAMARVAVSRIDLRCHSGEHPRFGAMDVCPLVPLRGMPMARAVELSRELGRALAEELALPVFLYEESAVSPGRRDLASVRRIGRAGLDHPLEKEAAPDFGPARFHPTAGAAAVGARGPLVAFNVNLAVPDLAAAKDIAAELRRRRDLGEGFEGVKALGFLLASRSVAQVSTNVTRPDRCRPKQVFDFIESAARRRGVPVRESELIGVASRRHLPEQEERAMRLVPPRPSQILETWLGPDVW